MAGIKHHKRTFKETHYYESNDSTSYRSDINEKNYKVFYSVYVQKSEMPGHHAFRDHS